MRAARFRSGFRQIQFAVERGLSTLELSSSWYPGALRIR
jgi:hypothetical protein